MTKLKFTDGEEFNTSGPLRVEERKDGFYLVGEGCLIPIKSKEEGYEMITKRTSERLTDEA